MIFKVVLVTFMTLAVVLASAFDDEETRNKIVKKREQCQALDCGPYGRCIKNGQGVTCKCFDGGWRQARCDKPRRMYGGADDNNASVAASATDAADGEQKGKAKISEEVKRKIKEKLKQRKLQRKPTTAAPDADQQQANQVAKWNTGRRVLIGRPRGRFEDKKRKQLPPMVNEKKQK